MPRPRTRYPWWTEARPRTRVVFALMTFRMMREITLLEPRWVATGCLGFNCWTKPNWMTSLELKLNIIKIKSLGGRRRRANIFQIRFDWDGAATFARTNNVSSGIFFIHSFLQYCSHQYWMGSINCIYLFVQCPCCRLTRQHQRIFLLSEKTPEPWFEPGPAGREARTLPVCYADHPFLHSFD